MAFLKFKQFNAISLQTRRISVIVRGRGIPTMLEAINLSKHYNGVVALDLLNLKIEPGEVFCLLGANGAGKTTTINLFQLRTEEIGHTDLEKIYLAHMHD
jgi:ABC-type uncharacterized transport system ATPase subunit